MYDGTSPSDPQAPATSAQRARGRVRIAAIRKDGRTRLQTLYQDGAAKARLPRVHGDLPLEAVLLNTAGGLTGGDVIETEALAGPGAGLCLTGQACERIYRALPGEPPARVVTTLQIEAGARLAWLPQETILFDGGRVRRKLDIDMAADGWLLACEAVLFGRGASGETLSAGDFRDSWRLRRGGRLVFADETRLDGPIDAILKGAAVAAGGQAVATVVLAAPDAGDHLQQARDILAGAWAGASLRDGILVCRLVAADGQALRAHLLPLLSFLNGGGLPRVWHL